MVTRRPSTAPPSASHFWLRALPSPPAASTARPARIGTQMASERSGTLPMPEAPDDPAHAEQNAEQHEEGIGIHKAGLQQADHAREPAHDPRRAVHHQAVDHRLVAGAPETAPERARAAGKQPRIELIEAVLALDQRVERAKGNGDALREMGLFEVQNPSRHDSGHRQPE